MQRWESGKATIVLKELSGKEEIVDQKERKSHYRKKTL